MQRPLFYFFVKSPTCRSLYIIRWFAYLFNIIKSHRFWEIDSMQYYSLYVNGNIQTVGYMHLLDVPYWCLSMGGTVDFRLRTDICRPLVTNSYKYGLRCIRLVLWKPERIASFLASTIYFLDVIERQSMQLMYFISLQNNTCVVESMWFISIALETLISNWLLVLKLLLHLAILLN